MGLARLEPSIARAIFKSMLRRTADARRATFEAARSSCARQLDNEHDDFLFRAQKCDSLEAGEAGDATLPTEVGARASTSRVRSISLEVHYWRSAAWRWRWHTTHSFCVRRSALKAASNVRKLQINSLCTKRRRRRGQRRKLKSRAAFFPSAFPFDYRARLARLALFQWQRVVVVAILETIKVESSEKAPLAIEANFASHQRRRDSGQFTGRIVLFALWSGHLSAGRSRARLSPLGRKIKSNARRAKSKATLTRVYCWLWAEIDFRSTHCSATHCRLFLPCCCRRAIVGQIKNGTRHTVCLGSGNVANTRN